jgi:hypothetical protein
MALSRGYLWGILGLFALLVAGMAFLFLRPSSRAIAGLRWLVPVSVSGPSAPEGPSGSAAAENIFDGKLSTVWAAPAGREEAEIEFAFSDRVLVTGILIEAGYLSPDASAPGYAAPRTASLEFEGRKPVRLALAEGDAPQFLPLPGLLAGKGRLRFALAPGAAAKAMAVREVRFLGLPYE